MYLTYDEYENMGGTMDDAIFLRLEAKARKRIDAVTFGRLCNETPVRESVKQCMFELIGAMYEDELVAGLSGRDVAAVSNDGVSISYSSGSSTSNARSAGTRYSAIVRSWLMGEVDACGKHLLYAGVSL